MEAIEKREFREIKEGDIFSTTATISDNSANEHTLVNKVMRPYGKYEAYMLGKGFDTEDYDPNEMVWYFGRSKDEHFLTPCGTFLSEYLLAIADLFGGRKVKCYKGKEQFDGSRIPIFIDDEGTEALVMPIAISNTVDDFPKVSYTDNRKEIYF